MIARFDKLNRFETPQLSLCNPGSVYKDGVTTNTLGILTDVSDVEIVFNFNTMSELSFRLTRCYRDNKDEDKYVAGLYKAVQNRRFIFVDDIGYFVITNVVEGFSDGLEYKDVSAQSCEAEIANKSLPYIENGTYQFCDLLNALMKSIPKWTVGDIATGVSEKYRTFQDVDIEKNVLAFLLDDMQDAYECIFVCDIQRRIINVFDQNDYVLTTDIHLTKDDLVNRMQVTENSDDLYTALNVFGDENLNIAPVNPLGTSVIYDFSHYLDWMSDGLRERVVAWQTLLDSKQEEYIGLSLEFYTCLGEISNDYAEIDRLQILRSMYKSCRDNIVAESNTSRTDSYNEEISSAGGSEIPISDNIEETLTAIDELIEEVNTHISELQQAVEESQVYIDEVSEQISLINKQLSFQENFTDDEYSELYDYIFQGIYRDEYIATTSTMSYPEMFEQMKVLYERAKRQIGIISRPTQEYSVEVGEFLFIKDFIRWSEQLETGCLINAELQDDDIAMLFLTTIVVNYDEQSMSLTFGNRFCRFDPKSLFENVLGGIKKSANTIEYIKDALTPITDGQFNAMQEALNNSRTLTMQAALASKGEEVVIDGSGYTGRKLLPDGTYDPRQVKLTGNSLVFTDDAWQSCKVAIGELLLDADGTSTYGINAQSILGEMIIGGQLHILDSDGNDIFSVIDGKIESSIKNLDGLSSVIEQMIDSLRLEVVNNDTSSVIRLTSDSIELSSQTIQMSGVVTFSDLSGSGRETIINGDNIVTGTISSKDKKSFYLDLDKGTFYSTGKFMSEDGNSYITVNGNEFTLFAKDSRTLQFLPKFRLGFNSDENGTDYPWILIGNAGEGEMGLVKKFRNGLWVGNSVPLNAVGAFTPISRAAGFFIDTANGTPYTVEGGVMRDITVAVFG